MEIIIIAVAVIIIAFLIFKNVTANGKKTLDVNNDGKVNVEDVKVVVKQTKAAVKTRTQRKNKPNGSSTKQ